MTPFPLRLAALATCLAAPDAAAQAVVADYANDFNATAPAAGWRYLWNAPAGWAVGATGDQASGFIGDPTGYVTLVAGESGYTPDGDATGSNNAPAGFLRLSATGGHPGPAAGSPNRRPRHAIAAYTVATAGLYSIEASSLSVAATASDGVEVLVFPGKSEAVLRRVALPGTPVSFDIEIGHLEAGQTIYVAFGPGASANSDTFLMDFSVVRRDRRSFIDQVLDGIAAGRSVITVLPGRYYVNPTGAYSRIQAFNPATPATIVADGVQVISQSANRVIGFINSGNFTLRGLTIDFDPPLFRQGTVESISGPNFNLRLHEGYPQTLTSEASSGILYVPSTLQMKQLTDTLYPTGTSQVEPGLYTIQFGSRPGNLAVGDLVTLTEPTNIPHTVYLENCSRVRVEDVTIHGAPAFAFLSRDAYDVTVQRVRVVPGPTPLRASVQRLLASNADGIHFKGSTGLINVLDCELAYLGDDCIILTSSYSPILEKPQGNVITISPKNRTERFQAGDRLYVYDPVRGVREEVTILSATSSPLTEAAIQAQIASLYPTVRLSSSTFEIARTLTLSKAVTGGVGGWIANREGDSSGFVVAGNRIQNTRARGILIKASNGIVTGNEIINTLLPGIQVRPESDVWMEGDFAQNVVIEDNDLRRCALGRSNSWGPIYVSSEGFYAWKPGNGHVNITIARNRIYNAPGASIIVRYADDVKIRSNRFITSHNILGTSPWYDTPIRIDDANLVQVLGLNVAMRVNATNANLASPVGTGSGVTGLAIVAPVQLDGDEDQLPDTWEQQYFGDASSAKPGDDPDRDGFSNLQELIALTDPTRPDPFAARIEAGTRVAWSPRPNRFVTVLSQDTPSGPTTVLAEDLPGETGTFDLPAQGSASSRFYRLVVTD